MKEENKFKMNIFLWIALFVCIIWGYTLSFNIGYMQNNVDKCYLEGIIVNEN